VGIDKNKIPSGQIGKRQTSWKKKQVIMILMNGLFF